MKKIATVLAAGLVMVTGLSISGHADAVKKSMAAKYFTCPACHMKMMTKKSAAAPIPVTIKGVTYYCCAGCPAGKAHMKHAKTM